MTTHLRHHSLRYKILKSCVIDRSFVKRSSSGFSYFQALAHSLLSAFRFPNLSVSYSDSSTLRVMPL